MVLFKLVFETAEESCPYLTCFWSPEEDDVKCSVADPGCLSRIPDPTFFHPESRIRTVSILDPGSRILIKEFKYFNPKKSKKIVSKL